MARPTDTPYNWNTAGGNRTAPTSGLQGTGFLSRTPIPSQIVNALFGVAFDWIAYFAGSKLSYVDDAEFWIPGVGGWLDQTAQGNITITENNSTDTVTFTVGGSTPARAMRSFQLAMGGAINDVRIYIETLGGSASIDVEVRIYAADHHPSTPKYQQWSGTFNTVGEKSLGFSAGDSPGYTANTELVPGPVAVVMLVDCTVTSSDAEIAGFFIEFADPA